MFPSRVAMIGILAVVSGQDELQQDRKSTAPEMSRSERQKFYRGIFSGRYEKLIGTWVSERKDDDGTVVRETHTYRWVLGHQFVERLVTVLENNQVVLEGKVMIGMNGLTLQDQFWGFDSLGSHWQSTDVLSHEGKQWIIKYVGSAENQTNSWTEVLDLDRDVYKVTSRDHLGAGILLYPDEGPFEFKRQPD